MKPHRISLLICSALLVLVVSSPARAAWPVIDVGAIAQLILQIQTLMQQLDTARSQLTETKQTFQSMTGGRGMERLLSGTARNYLPPDWAELERAMQGASGTYTALAAGIQGAITANAVLTPQQVAALSPAERESLEAARRSAATLQVLARDALANTSQRFAAIQSLINAIPGAGDQKAILDLQARISAEQGMLANEQTKLQVLYQAAQAEEWARKERLRERAVADIGSLRRLPPMGL